MQSLIHAMKWLLCSGHEFQHQPALISLRTECPARSMCFGCDGKINCHLAKMLIQD